MLVAPRISECFGLLLSALVCYNLPWTWSAIDASHLTSSFAPFGRSARYVGLQKKEMEYPHLAGGEKGVSECPVQSCQTTKTSLVIDVNHDIIL